MTLKARQEQVLRAVVEEFIASGLPVGSKHLTERFEFGAAASTIRSDLAELEEVGFLDHPHTSAGRVPTDAGYRYYVDTIVVERRDARTALPLRLQRVRAEIDEALEETAEALSQVTELLAIVSSPSLTSTAIRHIEILPLQVDVVMVVIITTSGRVTKRVFQFASRVDEGLVEFARVYLNERLTGFKLGTRAIEKAFSSPELGAVERTFLAAVRPAFEVVVGQDPGALHMGGTARLLERLSGQGIEHLNDVVAQLEERYNLLELLSGALRDDDVYLRIGHEMGEPSLQSCSLVAANYGVANRNLGTVSVLGPRRMDYQGTIAAVRGAAGSLSSLMEEIW
jgi:heat-inducible transcriptional repressor